MPHHAEKLRHFESQKTTADAELGALASRRRVWHRGFSDKLAAGSLIV
jgi:hypothetical protein